VRKNVIGTWWAAANSRQVSNSPERSAPAPSHDTTTNWGGRSPGLSLVGGAGWLGCGPVSAVLPSPMSRTGPDGPDGAAGPDGLAGVPPDVAAPPVGAATYVVGDGAEEPPEHAVADRSAPSAPATPRAILARVPCRTGDGQAAPTSGAERVDRARAPRPGRRRTRRIPELAVMVHTIPHACHSKSTVTPRLASRRCSGGSASGSHECRPRRSTPPTERRQRHAPSVEPG